MKLEKREVTLNERDSLLDLRVCAEMLLERYAQSAVCLERKETRTRVKTAIADLLDVIYTLNDRLDREE